MYSIAPYFLQKLKPTPAWLNTDKKYWKIIEPTYDNNHCFDSKIANIFEIVGSNSKLA